MATHDKVTDDREPSTVVVRETGKGRFQQEVISYRLQIRVTRGHLDLCRFSRAA